MGLKICEEPTVEVEKVSQLLLALNLDGKIKVEKEKTLDEFFPPSGTVLKDKLINTEEPDPLKDFQPIPREDELNCLSKPEKGKLKNRSKEAGYKMSSKGTQVKEIKLDEKQNEIINSLLKLNISAEPPKQRRRTKVRTPISVKSDIPDVSETTTWRTRGVTKPTKIVNGNHDQKLSRLSECISGQNADNCSTSVTSTCIPLQLNSSEFASSSSPSSGYGSPISAYVASPSSDSFSPMQPRITELDESLDLGISDLLEIFSDDNQGYLDTYADPTYFESNIGWNYQDSKDSSTLLNNEKECVNTSFTGLGNSAGSIVPAVSGNVGFKSCDPTTIDSGYGSPNSYLDKITCDASMHAQSLTVSEDCFDLQSTFLSADLGKSLYQTSQSSDVTSNTQGFFGVNNSSTVLRSTGTNAESQTYCRLPNCNVSTTVENLPAASISTTAHNIPVTVQNVVAGYNTANVQNVVADCNIANVQNVPAACSATNVHHVPAACSATNVRHVPAACSATNVRHVPAACSATNVRHVPAACNLPNIQTVPGANKNNTFTLPVNSQVVVVLQPIVVGCVMSGPSSHPCNNSCSKEQKKHGVKNPTETTFVAIQQKGKVNPARKALKSILNLEILHMHWRTIYNDIRILGKDAQQTEQEFKVIHIVDRNKNQTNLHKAVIKRELELIYSLVEIQRQYEEHKLAQAVGITDVYGKSAQDYVVKDDRPACKILHGYLAFYSKN